MAEPTAVPATLDRGSPLPLWAQLRDDLRRRLRAGDFADRLPTDQELQHTYQVSRQTAREAVRRLGVTVDRQRGKGTFLVTPQFEQTAGALYSLFRSIEAQGVEQRSTVLGLDVRTDADAAAHLELPANAPLVFLQRLRLAAGAPLALDTTWLPADVARPLLTADFTHTALYDELEHYCGVRPQRGEERIHPLVPSRAEARLLHLGAGHAVFAIERRTWSATRLLEYRRSIVRGDRYGFVSHWGQDEPTGLLRLARTA